VCRRTCGGRFASRPMAALSPNAFTHAAELRRRNIDPYASSDDEQASPLRNCCTTFCDFRARNNQSISDEDEVNFYLIF